MDGARDDSAAVTATQIHGEYERRVQAIAELSDKKKHELST